MYSRKLSILNLFFLILLGIITIAGCKKEDETDLSLLKHSFIKGFNTKYHSNNLPFYNYDSIKVELKGNINKTTYTDSTGHYHFNDIPTGTYKIAYSKKNYGTVKIYGIEHFGTDTTIITTFLTLYEKIKREVTAFGKSEVDTLFWKIHVPFSSDSVIDENTTDMIIYIKQGDTASYMHYDQYYTSYISNTRSEPYDYTFYLDIYKMLKDGFTSNQEINIKCYLKNVYDEGYTDFEELRYVFPTTNTEGGSEQITLILPEPYDIEK